MIITQGEPKCLALSVYHDKDPGPVHALGAEQDAWAWCEAVFHSSPQTVVYLQLRSSTAWCYLYALHVI